MLPVRGTLSTGATSANHVRVPVDSCAMSNDSRWLPAECARRRRGTPARRDAGVVPDDLDVVDARICLAQHS
jgi:hypothetical protein